MQNQNGVIYVPFTFHNLVWLRKRSLAYLYHTYPVKWNKANILYVSFTFCILVGCCWTDDTSLEIWGNGRNFSRITVISFIKETVHRKKRSERRWRYITARKYSLCSVTYYGERTLYKYVLNSEIPLWDTVKLRNVETRSGKQTSSFFFYLFWIFTPTMTKILALKNHANFF